MSLSRTPLKVLFLVRKSCSVYLSKTKLLENIGKVHNLSILSTGLKNLSLSRGQFEPVYRNRIEQVFLILSWRWELSCLRPVSKQGLSNIIIEVLKKPALSRCISLSF